MYRKRLMIGDIVVLAVVLWAFGNASTTLAGASGGPEEGGESVWPAAVVCGQTLGGTDDGPYFDDFTKPGHYTFVNSLRPGETSTVFVFTGSCKTGVAVAIKPHGALTIADVARTEDHKIAAVSIVPRRKGTAQIVVTRPHGYRTVVAIHVVGPALTA